VTQQEGWPKLAVDGRAAVGGYLGGLPSAAGAGGGGPVVMIGRSGFVERLKKSATFPGKCSFKRVYEWRVTESSAVRGAEIGLFA